MLGLNEKSGIVRKAVINSVMAAKRRNLFLEYIEFDNKYDDKFVFLNKFTA